MTNPKEQEINEMVRDFTQVKPRAKSEVKRRILGLLHSDREAVRGEIDCLCDGDLLCAYHANRGYKKGWRGFKDLKNDK